MGPYIVEDNIDKLYLLIDKMDRGMKWALYDPAPIVSISSSYLIFGTDIDSIGKRKKEDCFPFTFENAISLIDHMASNDNIQSFEEVVQLCQKTKNHINYETFEKSFGKLKENRNVFFIDAKDATPDVIEYIGNKYSFTDFHNFIIVGENFYEVMEMYSILSLIYHPI